jgi:hypothetical protein
MRTVSTGRTSPLSLLAAPFFPTKQSAGRPKALRWMEDSGDSRSDCVSSAAQSPCLEAARRAVSPVPAVPCEGDCSASRPVLITKKRRRRCCRARTRDANGPPVVPPCSAARVPTHQRLGPQPVVRVPMHQRLGQRRRASPADGRHRRCCDPL